MTVSLLGRKRLDYQPCRYGNSRVQFRGPERHLGKPYVAFLGGTHTYGKFVEQPFPQRVENQLQVPCVNFGSMNAGIDLFLHEPVLRQAAIDAKVTAIQVLSPRNMNNRFYSVHPLRNDRFVKPSLFLKALYPDIDFSEIAFTRHLLIKLQTKDAKRFRVVVDELKTAWASRMRFLLAQIPGPVVLYWFSKRAPRPQAETFGDDPWFVTTGMIDDLRPMIADFVQVVPSEKARRAGTDGMVHAEEERLMAEKLLGPSAHEEAAEMLAASIKRHL